MGAKRFGALVTAALLVAGACTDHHPATTAPATTAPAPSSSVLAEPSTAEEVVVDAGPELVPEHLGTLPNEGVAFEDPHQGVVLVGLDGRTLGHLPDLMLYDNPGPAGPLLMRPSTGRTIYRLDPGAHALVRAVGFEEVHIPLAYGAAIVSYEAATPGGAALERPGHKTVGVYGGVSGDYTVANDRDIVSWSFADETVTHAIDLRTGETRSLSSRCEVADRHGERWYLICVRPATGDRDAAPAQGAPVMSSIEVMVGSSRPTVVAASPVTLGADGAWVGGTWTSAAVSPDGAHLLAEQAGDCDSQSTYLMTTSGGDLTSVGTIFHAPTSLGADGLGWTLAGDAVVAIPPRPACKAGGSSGLFLIRPGGEPRRIHALPDPTFAPIVLMWQPLLK